VQIDLVRARQNAAYFALQTPVAATAPGVVSPDAPRTVIVPAGAEWTLAGATPDQVSWRYATTDGVEVTKTFRRLAGRYAFALDVDVKNVSATAGQKRIVAASVDTFTFQDPNVRERSLFHYAEPTWATACYVGGEYLRDAIADLKNGAARVNTGDVRWTGPDHQYFLFGYGPLASETATCTRGYLAGAQGVLHTSLQQGLPAALEPNQSVTQSFVVYAGPKLIDDLEAASKLAGKEAQFKESVDLGWFAILGRPMLFLLKLFHGWTGSWGIAIVLLTVVVKLLTLYWTQKSMRSMKALSKLKPEMDKVREKYGDNKAKQNEELLKLYKTHQISPFGGCLPMVLQMPIWLALYSTLAAAADLYRAPFLGYIDDLTAPDPYYILPVLLTGLMFWQMRLTPSTGDNQQQKIMQWVLPIMMGVFSLLFPSGLAVYMLTNTILGMIHQVYMNRTDPSPARVVAAPASAPAPAAAVKRPEGRPGRKNGKKR
jgi:YidC/Oxa1 family membrane protein insertase